MVSQRFTGLLLALGAGVSAQLENIPNFGDNPTGLTLDVYRPSNLPANPAIILALHPCGSSGPGYADLSGYRSYADSQGIIVLYPSSLRDFNCWDVATTASLTRDGGGDSTGLASAVKYALDTWSADPERVFVSGASSGCMMTNVMIAAYPDLFNAATCYSGVAAGCLKGSPGSSPISADPTCANGDINLTPEEWAQRARDIYPGYTGEYPRLKTLHGTADNLVFIPNLEQQLAQWSTIHGIEQTTSNPDTPQSGYTELVYGDGTKLVGYSAEGVGHIVPPNPALDIDWFGL
jgi:acetylxylan esterase